MMILLGCIADDFTGATDLANNLVRAGMRVVQTIGVPTAPLGDAADAVVVALKSRTIAPAEAVAQSLSACRRPGSRITGSGRGFTMSTGLAGIWRPGRRLRRGLPICRRKNMTN